MISITQKLEDCIVEGLIGFSMLIWRDKYQEWLDSVREKGYEDLNDWFKDVCLAYPISYPTVSVRTDGCQTHLDFEWSFD